MRAAVRVAMDTKLKAWADAQSPALVVDWPRVPGTIDREAMYLKPALLPGERRPVTLGVPDRHKDRQYGVYQIIVMAPSTGGTTWGPGPVDSVVDDILQEFRAGQALAASPVSVSIERVSDGPALRDDADRHSVPVSVTYRAELLVTP